MKAVGVKELKARLSEHLRAVRAGETFLITDRSEVIAELRPTSRRPAGPASLDDVLDDLADAGQITRARASKDAWQWKPRGLGLSRAAVRGILDDVRGDRDEA